MKYLPLQEIVAVLTLEQCRERCARLNAKNPHLHFKPQRAGSGYQVVAAPRNS